jgi:uncharacterized protein (DUF1697 family)
MTILTAFLRGVNLGKRKMKMADLTQSFARLGFTDAKTLLASGNVVFSAPSPNVGETIEHQLYKDFGFEVEVILRELSALEVMVSEGPFGRRKSEADKKFYIFLARDPIDPDLVPVRAVPGDFTIDLITAREIYATAYRQPSGRFGEGLDQVAKPFGRHFTNRNWNTILRMLDAGAKLQ